MPDITPPRALIVDDEQAQAEGLAAAVELLGYSASSVMSAKAALAILREQAFDIVLVDLLMPEMGGIAFLRAAYEIDPDMVGIVLTGYGTIDGAVEAMQAGALDYIVKPVEISAVQPVLVRALAVRRLRLQNLDLQQVAGIYELSMVIRLTLDFDVVLQKVADAAMGHPQVCSISLLLPTEDGTELCVAVAGGQNIARDSGKRIPFTPALTGWAENSLKHRSNPNELSHVQEALPLTLSEIPGGTCLPMLAGGRFIGILNFTSKNPGRPVSPRLIKALNILAGAAASALEALSLLEQLRSAERRYRRLSESAADVIFRYELHPQRRFAYINPAIKALTDYSPQEHYSDPDLILNIVHPDDRHLMENVLCGRPVTGGMVTLRWVHRNANAVWIELRITPVKNADGRLIAIESIGRDVTERKHLEEQLRQSQKMEAIGLLAGGVAHDFNNLLTVIIGYSDLVLVDDKPPASIVEKVSQVKKAAEQAADLTRQLLAFGRRQFLHTTVLDLNAVVESSSKMLRRIIGEDIQFVTTLDAGLGHTKADTAQIEQILMNLAVNAKYAMPQGGRITLETKNVTLDETRIGGIEAAAPGPYVMLAVTDTGCGMDASTQARIFEPFYTTKELGKGTGLGLSIIYGIVKQSAGQIRVFSQPGQGARFEILLPRSEGMEECPELPAIPSEASSGSETILVVEDNAGVCELIRTVLQRRGYEVLVARDGNEALRIHEQHDGKIGLILTDLIMPGMGGLKLVESLQRLHRGTKILLMSGYGGESSHGRLTSGMSFIQKPFTSENLVGKIREMLDSGIAQTMMRGSQTA